MIVVTDKEIYSDASKYVHRIGTDIYFKRSIKLPNDSVEMFEEVDSIPTPPTEEDLAYKAEVEDKVKTMFFSANIQSQINNYNLSDREALAVKDFYPPWKEGIDVKKGENYTFGEDLFHVDQDHKTQADWAPDKQSSLWHEVTYHAGTKSDPIPWNENHNPSWQGMLLELGKYYTQDNILYECIRDSEGVKLIHNLSDLVSAGYVKEVQV